MDSLINSELNKIFDMDSFFLSVWVIMIPGFENYCLIGKAIHSRKAQQTWPSPRDQNQHHLLWDKWTSTSPAEHSDIFPATFTT